MLGALLWWVRPRGELTFPKCGAGFSYCLNLQSIQHQMRLEKALWCHMVSMEKIYSNIAADHYTSWNHFCTFVTKLNEVLTIYLTLIHPATKLPCFNSRTHLQKYGSSLPTLQTLQFGTSPKLVWILKIKHLKDKTWRRESTRIKMEDTNEELQNVFLDC